MTKSVHRTDPDEHFQDRVTRIYSDTVCLAEGQTESWETITRIVTFHDSLYGLVELTREKLLSMVKNFREDVYGQEIAIDVSHNHSNGAAGFIRELQVQGSKLRGRIEWTRKGIKAVTEDGFRYFSADFHEDYEDPETGKRYGATLLGAGLTTRPRVKRLDPVNPDRLQLSLDGDDPAVATVLSPYLSKKMYSEITNVKDKFKKQYQQVLEGIKALSDDARGVFLAQFEAVLDGIADEAQAKSLLSAFTKTAEGAAKQLSASPDDRLERLFADKINGCKGFDDEMKKQLTESAIGLITPDMSEDQVIRLATNQITLGDRIVAQKKLASMGYQAQPAGSVHISVDHSNELKSLQETIDRRLGLSEMRDYRRFSNTGGQLQHENKKFAEKVLEQFDAKNRAQLHAEHKQMAAGDGLVGDVAVPAAFERTVIREALYNLVGLNFVQADSLEFASSVVIPYSYRDPTAAGRNNTRVYEGGSIPRAGIIQTSDTAYPIPQKIAFAVSDELMHLTSSGILNWDAAAENAINASRIIREDTEQLIFNEVIDASDEFSVTAVVNENLELQADGSKTIFITAQFPIVRPRAIYDHQGNQVGTTSNPIAVSYSGSTVTEFDGTGTQASGTYYVIDYNLGEIYLVNEAGVVQTPADGTAYTISYSYTTNVYKFDSDLGGSELEVHWDTFLYRYGLRKSIIEDDRYHMANFGLMSGNLMTMVEQAKKFGANSKRPGTDLAMDGNLGMIKDVPNFKTSAPGLTMGDTRAVIGERGVTRLRMLKGWTMSNLENQKDANGRFIGKKEAYGNQYIVLHTPTPLKRAYTSIVVYSATARVAR